MGAWSRRGQAASSVLMESLETRALLSAALSAPFRSPLFHPDAQRLFPAAAAAAAPLYINPDATAPLGGGDLSRQVDLSIGAATGRQASPLGVNIGPRDAYSQTNTLNDLLTQNGGFETASGRIPFQAAAGSTDLELVAQAAWAYNLDAASLVGQRLTGTTGANAGLLFRIVSVREQRDAFGQTTGNLILATDARFVAPPANADVFALDVVNYGAWKLADNISGWGNSLITRSVSVAHTGSASAQIVFGGGSGAKDNYASLTNWYGADSGAGRNVLLPGHTYDMTFWVKSAQPALAQVVLKQGNIAGGQEFSLPGDGQWHQYTLTVASSSSTAIKYENGEASLGFYGNNATVYVDDWHITDRTDTISAGDPISKSMRDLITAYGFGELRYWHPQLRFATFDQLVGPRDARQAVLQANDVYAPQFGLPEMLQLAKDTHTTPWIVISPLWTPTDVQHLMEYLAGDVSTPYGALRAADGHPGSWLDEFSVIKFESGNESWNGTFFPYSFYPFESYFTITESLFRSFKATPQYQANPSRISLIVNGWQWVPWYTNKAIDLTPSADAVSVSSYTGGPNADMDMRALLGNVLAMPVNEIAGQYPPEIFRKKVYVYEENAGELNGTVPSDKESAYATSLAAGLTVARRAMLNMRDYGITSQQLFTLIQRGDNTPNGFALGHYGLFNDMTTSASNPRPVALAARLLNHARGDILATTISNSWMVDATASGQAATTAADDAMVTLDGQRLVVTLFNNTVDDAQSATFHFTLPAQLAGGCFKVDWTNVTCQLLAGDLAANNETTSNIQISDGNVRHVGRDIYLTLPAHAMGSLILPLVMTRER